MKSWILAARPKTLPAAVVPVWTGAWAARELTGRFSWTLVGCTLASAICIQIATNFFNDAIDARKGADTAERLGPVRATASGLLSSRQVLGAGVVVALLAAGFGLPLVLAQGWVVVVIGVVSLLLAYGYTGGPYPLAYRGLGELFVLLFFGFVAVGGSYFVQTGEAPRSLVWLLGFQTGAYSTVLIAINNLRDREGDAKVGKHTLAVRFGERFARWEIAVMALAPLAGAVVWAWRRDDPGHLLPLLAAPLSIWIVRQVWVTPPGREYNMFLALSGVQLLLFGMLFTMGAS